MYRCIYYYFLSANSSNKMSLEPNLAHSYILSCIHATNDLLIIPVFEAHSWSFADIPRASSSLGNRNVLMY